VDLGVINEHRAEEKETEEEEEEEEERAEREGSGDLTTLGNIAMVQSMMMTMCSSQKEQTGISLWLHGRYDIVRQSHQSIAHHHLPGPVGNRRNYAGDP